MMVVVVMAVMMLPVVCVAVSTFASLTTVVGGVREFTFRKGLLEVFEGHGSKSASWLGIVLIVDLCAGPATNTVVMTGYSTDGVVKSHATDHLLLLH